MNIKDLNYDELVEFAEYMMQHLPKDVIDDYVQSHVADAAQCLDSVDSRTRDELADALIDVHRKFSDDKD